MSEGADFVNNDILHYRELNDIKNNHAGSSEPTSPVAGCRFLDTDTNQLNIYRSSAFTTFGSTADPFPVGSILPWCPGYFGNGSNDSFTNVLGNTVANANSYLNPFGWWVCDGSVPSEASSDIWDQAGRYLPELTDDRFIMGDTVVGGLGGSSTRAHTHTVDPDSKTSGVNNNWYRAPDDEGGTTVADHTHTHDLDLAQFTTEAASNTENRPLYLAMLFVIRVL